MAGAVNRLEIKYGNTSQVESAAVRTENGVGRSHAQVSSRWHDGRNGTLFHGSRIARNKLGGVETTMYDGNNHRSDLNCTYTVLSSDRQKSIPLKSLPY